MSKVDEFLKAIDKASAELLQDKERIYLGGSQIGGECARKVWYSFRGAYRVEHGGRLLRLFNRGHEEEHRVIRWLRAANVTVRDYAQRLLWLDISDNYETVPWDADWEGDIALGGFGYRDVSQDPLHIKRAEERRILKQWGFKDLEGHFRGHGDGKIIGLEKWFPELEDLGWGLIEIKTEKDKGHERTAKTGVLGNHQEHYIQMQVYMHYFGLKWGLYVAVNKNTDHLYAEIVYYKPEVAEMYIKRAKDIVEARQAPPKIKEDPSWFKCKWCDYREICHYGKEPQKNCRSCQYASAVKNGWHCGHFGDIIPEGFLPTGCKEWTPIK